MEININEFINYYVKANISFVNIYKSYISPQSIFVNNESRCDYARFVIPLIGKACFSLDNTLFHIKPGMVVHAGSGVTLDKEIIGNQECCFVVIYYCLPEHELVTSPYYHINFKISVGVNPRLNDIVQQLLLRKSKQSSMAVLQSKILFYNVIEEILLSAERYYNDDKAEIIDDAITFIHENYSQQFSITELAAQYNMDGKRFSELFQRHTDMTPIRYLIEFRIGRSKELLRTCDCPIMHIAECVGYINPYYFSRMFKKITGETPTEFRAKSKKVQT